MSDEELLKQAEGCVFDVDALDKLLPAELNNVLLHSIACSQLVIARNSVQEKINNVDVTPPKYYPPSVKVV